MYHANILARATRLFAKTPRLICTSHSNNEGGKLRMLSYRLTNCLADVFTNVSDDAVKAFEGNGAVAKGKMLSVANGIDTDFFQFSPEARQQLRTELDLEGKAVFIAIGRFHEAKDYPNLLNAFAELVKNKFDTHLLIVGDGELHHQIESQIKVLTLQEKVTLLGVRRDISELLSAADFYVMSSAWEGLPLVIGEAMAVEKLIVATDCGGTKQFIDDAGLLVPPKDSAALAQTMEKALNMDDAEALELGRKGRKRIIEHFSIDATVEKWLKIYSGASQ